MPRGNKRRRSLRVAPATARREGPGEHWRRLANFVRLLIWSGAVEGGRPQSIFLLSEPGQGKTELLERFRVNSRLEFFSDVTYQRLLPVLKQAQFGRVSHVVITEFQKIIARRRAIAESTIALCMQAMEEGVYQVGYGPVSRDFQGARFGLLAASTVRSIENHPYLITELALDSRAYFVDARSSEEEIIELERLITEGDRSLLAPIKIDLPDRRVRVDIPKPEGYALMEWVEEMRRTKGVRTYNARTLNRFRHTVAGVALSYGCDVVHRRHLDELYEYREYWLRGLPLVTPH